MTLLEAYDRASVLWCNRGRGIRSGVERVFYVGHTGYGVDLNADCRMHSMDENGHVTCGHTECLAREKQLDRRTA